MAGAARRHGGLRVARTPPAAPRCPRPHEHAAVQSLPETVQVLRPPGTWTVPGAFFFPFRPLCGLPSSNRVAGMSESAPESSDRIIRGIMIAVLVWGAILAAGSWTLNHDIRRPIIVMGCVLAFLGFWLAALAVRRRRAGRGGR